MADQATNTTDLNGALNLTEWGVIRATGADARSFLHGQLTQDVDSLAPGEARLAGFCSVKGRLSASFVIWTDVAGDVLLACSQDLLVPTLKRLSMFVMRAKCKLSDASAALPLQGLVGNVVPASSPWQTLDIDGRQLIRLPDSAGVARALLAGAGSLPAQEIPLAAWNGLEALSGVARVTAATMDQFVPQMVNFEVVGGVNFKKGCFPGQEVVARSQYRGTIKRRAYAVRCESALQPGQEIFAAADLEQPAGMVVLAGRLGQDTHVGLVELKIAAASETLHAGQPTGPLLTLTELPYAVPTEAE